MPHPDQLEPALPRLGTEERQHDIWIDLTVGCYVLEVFQEAHDKQVTQLSA